VRKMDYRDIGSRITKTTVIVVTGDRLSASGICLPFLFFSFWDATWHCDTSLQSRHGLCMVTHRDRCGGVEVLM
jgi:hypothetical protein